MPDLRALAAAPALTPTLAGTARRQDGVLSRRDVLGWGLPQSVIATHVRAGLWTPLLRGTYLVEPGHDPHRSWARSAVLIAPDAVLAGATAARLHGIEGVPRSGLVDAGELRAAAPGAVHLARHPQPPGRPDDGARRAVTRCGVRCWAAMSTGTRRAMSGILDFGSGVLDTVSRLPDTGAVGRTPARGRRNGVRLARLSGEMTQAGLAQAVGVSRQTIVALEAGDYAPSVYLALAVAVRLGTTVEDLFGEAPSADRPATSNEVEASR